MAEKLAALQAQAPTTLLVILNYGNTSVLEHEDNILQPSKLGQLLLTAVIKSSTKYRVVRGCCCLTRIYQA